MTVQTEHINREAFKEKAKREVKYQALRLEQKGLIKRRLRKKIGEKTLEEVGKHFDGSRTFIRETLYKLSLEILGKKVEVLEKKLKERRENKVFLREKVGCPVCIFAEGRQKHRN